MKILQESMQNTPAWDELTAEYMPKRGAGDTMLTGLLVAANKIIYRWYNDGDVFDNIQNGLDGFANDISGSANWLVKYSTPQIRQILYTVGSTNTEAKYGKLIEDLEKALDEFAKNEHLVDIFNSKPLHGDPYDEDGPFEFIDKSYEEDMEDDWYEEDMEDDWY